MLIPVEVDKRTPPVTDRSVSLRSLILPVLLLLALTALIAVRTPLWFDEIFTFTVASQPGVKGVWTALLNGADNHAPLDYVVRNLSLRLPIQTELALRLPSLIAFAVFCTCMFLFVQRRAGRIAGLCAFTIPIATTALKHATEARGYATLLGFTGVAVLAWQSLETPDRKALKVASLAIALTGAITCHYYAVLLYAALFSAELFRWYWYRNVRLSAITGFAGALPGVVIAVPFARAASAYATGFWTPVSASDIPIAFATLYGTGTYLILIVAVMLVLSRGCTTSEHQEFHSDSRVVPDMVLGLTLTAAVVLCFVMAVLVTHAFYYRYAIVAVGGLSILLPMLVARHAPAKRNFQLLLATAVLLACINIGYRVSPRSWHDGPGSHMKAQVEAALSSSRGPIVWGDIMECLPLMHYFGSISQGRIVCLTGINGNPTLDRAASNLAPWTTLPIRKKSDFLRTVTEFAVVHPERVESDLLANCATAEKVPDLKFSVRNCTAKLSR